MKKFLALILIFPILLSCCFYIPGAGKRPYDFDQTKWVSETPDIWFEIDDDIDKEFWLDFYGEAKIGDEYVEITVTFDYGYGFYCTKKGEEDNEEFEYFRGFCTFDEDQLTVKIKKSEDNLYDGQYKEIVFVKYPIEETTADS